MATKCSPPRTPHPLIPLKLRRVVRTNMRFKTLVVRQPLPRFCGGRRLRWPSAAKHGRSEYAAELADYHAAAWYWAGEEVLLIA